MDTLNPKRASPEEIHFEPALPTEAPMAMPEQSLEESAPAAKRVSTAPRTISLRRGVLFLTTLLLTALAAWQMYLVVNISGLTWLQTEVLILFTILFLWIAFSFVSQTIGLCGSLFDRDKWLDLDPADPLPNIEQRCALLVPTYNEAPERLMARVEAMFDSLSGTGHIAHFDFFILSDTTDAEIWIDEEQKFMQLRQRTSVTQIFYRHRAKNTGRKAGNIAEWVRRFGARYAFMIVLDADSLMTGDTMVRLVEAMERHPHLGLLQTVPIVINAGTLFARLQQFAGRVYGPLVGYGSSWWFGAEGNYWGHNAILRVCAFAESAGLPTLSGRKPFGGEIMSHDFVEAALMRRRGWAIHLAPALEGSFEECPPTLDDYAIRDRRWCQGNLQHAAVLPAKGLHWISRLHLGLGICSYLASPMWLLFLMCGMLISLQARFIRPEYFPPDFSLFPKWPVQDPVRSAGLFVATILILIVPKMLGLARFASFRAERQRSGGTIRLIGSILLEIIISGLIAPVMMWMQSIAVLQILLGKDAGWQAQRRDLVLSNFGLTWRRYAPPTLVGALLGLAGYAVAAPLFFWMSPFILGLLLAAPMALVTSSARIGSVMRKAGLFLIPEEREPPAVLVRATQLSETYQTTKSPADIWQDLLSGPGLFTFHTDTLPEPSRARRQAIDAELLVGVAKLEQCETIQEALGILTRGEKKAILSDGKALQRLKELRNRKNDDAGDKLRSGS